MNAGYFGSLERFRPKILEGRSRTRTILILVMLVLLLATLVRFLTDLYAGYEKSLQNEVDIRMTQFNNMSRLIVDGERYQKEHAALSHFENEYIDSRLIRATTPSLAEAQFQNLINDMAKESNLNVQSLRVLPRTSQGNITSLKIGINCRGEIEAIKNFLHKAANHDKFVFIDQMEIRIISQREQRYFNFNAQLIAWTRP